MFDEMRPHHTASEVWMKLMWLIIGIALVVYLAHWFWNSH